MEHCNGCDKEVNDPIKLDSNCKLPFCKDCIIQMEDLHDIAKIDSFENPDNRKCSRCHKVFDIGSIVTHTGRYSKDCTLCRTCIHNIYRLIQDLKKC